MQQFRINIAKTDNIFWHGMYIKERKILKMDLHSIPEIANQSCNIFRADLKSDPRTGLPYQVNNDFKTGLLVLNRRLSKVECQEKIPSFLQESPSRVLFF